MKFGLNGFGRARSGFARMGCTVSFICCEEDFLQMPVYQHEEEKKKKESLKKVRTCGLEKRAGGKCVRTGVGVKTRAGNGV